MHFGFLTLARRLSNDCLSDIQDTGLHAASLYLHRKSASLRLSGFAGDHSSLAVIILAFALRASLGRE